ncbi:MAG: hypothetical protein ACI96W_002413 [Paraglaciecola sp.]|jgi:hypothetical protein
MDAFFVSFLDGSDDMKNDTNVDRKDIMFLEEADTYKVMLCTSNLGASEKNSGHPRLKHCYAKIIDSMGKQVDSLSFGLQGVVSEPNVDTTSTQCETLSSSLTHAQVSNFISEYKRQGNLPYQWGKNDCCSVLAHAVKVGLDLHPAQNVATAQSGLRNSRDFSRNMSTLRGKL